MTKNLLRNFEPQSWIDWILIPFWLARFSIFWLGYQTYIYLVKVRYGNDAWKHLWVSRRDDPTPTMCHRCLWSGAYFELYHTYAACGEDDVEPVSECPRCGAEL